MGRDRENPVEDLILELQFRLNWKDTTPEVLKDLDKDDVDALVNLINGINQNLGGPKFDADVVWKALIGEISTIDGLLAQINALDLGTFTIEDLLKKPAGELAAIMDSISSKRKVAFDQTAILSALSSLRARPPSQFREDSY